MDVAMNTDALPFELWIRVFELITQPADLLQIMRSCRRFYALSLRVLYRDIQWADPRYFFQSLPIWQADPTMAEVPRTLLVSIAPMHRGAFSRFDHRSAIVEADGTWQIPATASLGIESEPIAESPSVTPRPMAFYASRPLYQMLCDHIATFSMLEDLSFHHTTLGDSVYAVFEALPHLRTLSVTLCTFLTPVDKTRYLDLSNLPITDLTFLDVKGSTIRGIIQAFQLITARNLRSLKVDWYLNTASFFMQRLGELNVSYVLPAGLDEVEVHMPVYKSSLSAGVRDFFLEDLATFLTDSPTVTALSIVNSAPALSLPPHALPNLDTYSGPLSTVANVTAGRPLTCVRITETKDAWTDAAALVPTLARLPASTQALHLVLPAWDKEVLYPIAERLRALRILVVQYRAASPTEYTLLSMAALFLHRLPRLHTIHIYNGATTDAAELRAGAGIGGAEGGAGMDADEEVRELIVAWRKHCRSLREVRLVNGYVWRRAFDGDEWSKRILEEP